jgi:para-nitrobenzyl esterase
VTIVETTCGPIEGREKNGTLLFAGIPYAAPPVGEARFKAARTAEPWREVLSAKRFGPAAPQIPTGGLTSSAGVRWDEDCLTLNIATPAADGRKRPVLFWIHGGAYRTGQGAIPWYAGGKFATQGDIVTVSINYRLGVLGFLDLTHLGEDFATSGVNGLLDQITALQWVRDNIERFGGDPAKVTIAGESAGGFAVSTLLASPAAAGLFRGAIPQSGAAQHTLPKSAGEICAEKFMAATGSRTIDALQSLSADVVLDAQNAVAAEIGEDLGELRTFGVPVSSFYPVEGNRVIPKPPLIAIGEGAGDNVAVMTGSNRDETTLWGYGDVGEEKLTHFAGADPEVLLVALTTDHMFRIPAIRLLEARIGADPSSHSWLYQFDWRSRGFEGRLGATHALEIPFAFDNLDKAGVDVFLGPGESPQHVADVMHKSWTGFIRDQDPGWGAYDTDQRLTMRFNKESGVEADPEAEERLAWEGLR